MPEQETLAGTTRRLLLQAGWAPLAVIVAHEVGARSFGHEPVVDPVMHFSGGAAAAFFVQRACAVGGRVFGSPSPLGADLLALGLACAAALFWEFGEQLCDIYLGTHAHTSVTGTLRDLELGVAGAALYLAIGRAAGARRGGS